MANQKTLLNEIKKDLGKARKQERLLTAKQIVEELAPDIHAQLKQGARLDEVYDIIHARLPEGLNLERTTFKKYWREAREATGLSRIKNSGRRKASPTASTATGSPALPGRGPVRSGVPRGSGRDTSSDFRDDPDDI